MPSVLFAAAAVKVGGALVVEDAGTGRGRGSKPARASWFWP